MKKAMRTSIDKISDTTSDVTVYFLISCVKGENSGAGGHYHSLRVLIENTKAITAHTVVLGDFLPLVFQEAASVNLLPRNSTSINKFSEFVQTTRLGGVIIHAYDLKAGLWAIEPSWRLNAPLVVTKAGGKPQPSFVPRFPNMIYFQKTEYIKEARSSSVFRPNVEWVPQRLGRELSVGQNTKDPFQNNSPDVIKILRICRIGKIYAHSILTTFTLAKYLKERGESVEVVIIGKVEDCNVLRQLQRAAPAEATFLTSAEWSNNASRFITYADIVIGTGRSFMEGMRENKIMCVPATGVEEPIFIDKENFEEAFSHNFSPRVPVSCFTGFESNLNKIMLVLRNEHEKNEYIRFCQKVFDEYFDINNAVSKITFLYSHVKRLTCVQFFFLRSWSALYLTASRLKKTLQRIQ